MTKTEQVLSLVTIVVLAIRVGVLLGRATNN